jgi:phage-related protein
MANGLSREDFFAAFASGINNDAFLSKVTDPITVKFAKTAEQIKLAFEPLGLIILTALLAITPYVTSFIQMVSSGFESLGPTMQMAAVAFGAIATAIGPVIFGVGKLVAMLGGMGVTASGLGVAVLAAFGLMLQAVLPIIAMAALFGQAWYRNWDLVKQTFEAGVSAVSGVLASGLEILQSFWEQHGNSIMSYLSAWWNTLAEFVGGVMDIVSGALTVALMVIQGNWTGAWDAILQLTQTVWATITQFITNALSTVGSLIQAYLPIFIQGFKWAMTTLMELVGKAIGYVVYFIATLPQQLIRLVPQIITAAGQIGAAIWAGIKQGFAGGGGGTGAINNPGGPIDLFGNVIDSFKSLFNTSMPKSTIPSASSPAKTFLSPIKMEAIQTSKALDDVKNKMNQVKATAKPILKASTPAAAQPRSVYGKAVEVFDVTRRNDMESWEAALLRVMSKQAEGRLAIDIKDDTGRTQIGGTSANVAARYR